MKFEVVVAAGSYRAHDGIVFPHRWTAERVSVAAEFTGGHLYALSAAGCVLNDLYREAIPGGMVLGGARVRAVVALDPETWTSTGIQYAVEIDTDADGSQVDALLAHVEAVAEIPKALRVGTTVSRIMA